jgi:hypothetical protein
MMISWCDLPLYRRTTLYIGLRLSLTVKSIALNKLPVNFHFLVLGYLKQNTPTHYWRPSILYTLEIAKIAKVIFHPRPPYSLGDPDCMHT